MDWEFTVSFVSFLSINFLSLSLSLPLFLFLCLIPVMHSPVMVVYRSWVVRLPADRANLVEDEKLEMLLNKRPLNPKLPSPSTSSTEIQKVSCIDDWCRIIRRMTLDMTISDACPTDRPSVRPSVFFPEQLKQILSTIFFVNVIKKLSYYEWRWSSRNRYLSFLFIS